MTKSRITPGLAGIGEQTAPKRAYSDRVRLSLAHDANTTVTAIMEAIEREWKRAGTAVDSSRRKAVTQRVSQCAFLGETDIARITAYALR